MFCPVCGVESAQTETQFCSTCGNGMYCIRFIVICRIDIALKITQINAVDLQFIDVNDLFKIW